MRHSPLSPSLVRGAVGSILNPATGLALLVGAEGDLLNGKPVATFASTARLVPRVGVSTYVCLTSPSLGFQAPTPHPTAESTCARSKQPS